MRSRLFLNVAFISVISYNKREVKSMTREVVLMDAVAPNADESVMAREAGRRLATLLQAHATEGDNGVVSVSIGGAGAEDVAIPAVAARLLVQVLGQIGAGHAITLLPLTAELSTQEAAEILNVSRPYLVRLLDERQIPSRKVGTHRRVLLHDVLAYKQQDDERRHAVLDELTAQAQKLNMGY